MADLVRTRHQKNITGNENSCVLVMRQTNRVSIYDVTYFGKTFRMVWDRYRQEFSTALAADMLPHDAL